MVDGEHEIKASGSRRNDLWNEHIAIMDGFPASKELLTDLLRKFCTYLEEFIADSDDLLKIRLIRDYAHFPIPSAYTSIKFDSN